MSQVIVKVKTSGNLKALRDNLKAKTAELLKSAMDEAREVAFINSLQGIANGNTSCVVHDPIVDENSLSATLLMDGSQSLFVEYGAGDQTLPPYHSGDFSASSRGSGILVEKGYWYYNRTKYTGIRPIRPIYNASQAVKRYFEEHANEVFGK